MYLALNLKKSLAVFFKIPQNKNDINNKIDKKIKNKETD